MPPCSIKIRNIVHKGLGRFVEDDDDSGLSAGSVTKLRDILTFLNAIEHEGELRIIRSWKAHQLTGDQKGTWSLTVTETGG